MDIIIRDLGDGFIQISDDLDKSYILIINNEICDWKSNSQDGEIIKSLLNEYLKTTNDLIFIKRGLPQGFWESLSFYSVDSKLFFQGQIISKDPCQPIQH